jgi:Fic family protein
MRSLLLWYKENKKVLFPLHLAFEFHYRFERIHPFADGNGRIGRLLMNKILYDNKFIPLTIFSDNRRAYFRAFEKSINK